MTVSMQGQNSLPYGLLPMVAAALRAADPKTWSSDGSWDDRQALVWHHQESRQRLKTLCQLWSVQQLHLKLPWQHWAFLLSLHGPRDDPQLPCHPLKKHMPLKCLSCGLVQS